MKLTETELRVLIQEAAFKLSHWSSDRTVSTPKLIQDTVNRMKVHADAIVALRE
jgi:hypothetical protein